MCGIAGLVNWGDRDVLARMAGLLAHRGPDDCGIYEHINNNGTWTGLANRRLAILDLSPAGHMPMTNDDSTLTITYNGEVYNATELRARLEARGYRFHSRSDTEVVLKMYEEYGPNCVEHFDGMFAFAISDRRRDQLFLARDHFGVKPLYYVCRDGRFAFASEVKALMALPDMRVQICPESLQQYLTFLWVPEPATILSDVVKLPAAHWAVFKDGELRLHDYWRPQLPASGSSFTLSEDEVAERLRAELTRCVRQQMVSDVPIGDFLSGGIDSSAVVSTMRAVTEAPFPTYTISFPESARVGENTLDDPQTAADLAKSLGCEHHNIEVTPDVVGLLPRLAYQMDEPVADPAMVITYVLCREAGRDVSVLLSGVGGDELFAGYRKYQAHYWSEIYRRLPLAIRRHVLEPAINGLPTARGTRFQGPIRLAKKMVRSASLEPIAAALQNVTYMSPEMRAALCTNVSDCDPLDTHLGHLNDVRHADFLHRLMYLDFKTFLVSLNLAYTDKMSMASSVEVRVPFLDRRLTEFAFTEIAPSLKLKGRLWSTPKYILKRAMADRLPKAVLRAPKAGFGAPIQHWLTHDLREMTGDLLSPARIRSRGYFNPVVVDRIVSEHRTGKADCSYQIWQLLTFELWAQAFIDGRNTDHPETGHRSRLMSHGAASAARN